MRCQVLYASSAHQEWFREVLTDAIVETLDNNSQPIVKETKKKYTHVGRAVLLEPALLDNRAPINMEFFLEAIVINQE